MFQFVYAEQILSQVPRRRLDDRDASYWADCDVWAAAEIELIIGGGPENRVMCTTYNFHTLC